MEGADLFGPSLVVAGAGVSNAGRPRLPIRLMVALLYLKHAWDERIAQGKASIEDLLDAIREGAVLRVRPKAMTVAVILAGLFPIMWGTGTGSEVMQRIAAPMVGGMITAPLLSMFVVPVVFYLMRRRTQVQGGDKDM